MNTRKEVKIMISAASLAGPTLLLAFVSCYCREVSVGCAARANWILFPE
jgi:hypothetical protein